MSKGKGKRQNYAELQKGIDALIGRFGLTNTIKMISQLTSNGRIKKPNQQKIELLSTFIISESKEIFKWDERDKNGIKKKNYKDAKMACYHLLNKYSQMSYREIGSTFGQGKTAANYHIKKCEERLSIPKFYGSFVAQYNLLEQNIIYFIANLHTAIE